MRFWKKILLFCFVTPNSHRRNWIITRSKSDHHTPKLRLEFWKPRDSREKWDASLRFSGGYSVSRPLTDTLLLDICCLMRLPSSARLSRMRWKRCGNDSPFSFYIPCDFLFFFCFVVESLHFFLKVISRGGHLNLRWIAKLFRVDIVTSQSTKK